MRYAVIEIYDRETPSGLELCDTPEQAVDRANELLDARLAELGLSRDDLDAEVDYAEASASRHNAWCNHKGNWDAHVVPVEGEV